MTEKRSKPRGRPRTFDREVALRTVMDVFWQYGYEGTSISKLLEAKGLKAHMCGGGLFVRVVHERAAKRCVKTSSENVM